MKLTKTKKNKGMTLIELTVVILVLLSLISVLFIGARAWLEGSERAQAAILIRNAQQGMRSHSNLLGVTPSPLDTSGATPTPGTPVAWNMRGGTTLRSAVFGPSRYVETPAANMLPEHPAGGSETFREGAAGDFELVPGLTVVYMESTNRPEFYRPTGLQ